MQRPGKPIGREGEADLRLPQDPRRYAVNAPLSRFLLHTIEAVLTSRFVTVC